MSRPAPDVLAARWFDYWRRRDGSREERKALEAGRPRDVVAARDLVADMVERGVLEVVGVLSALAEAALTEDQVAMVGIGPVEDLLAEHGDRVVDELVGHGRRSEAFARALAYVSLPSGSTSAASRVKLQQFAK